MQEVTIKYLATKMKGLKEREVGSTILFLGAGVSRSAGIPLASEIMSQLEKDNYYKNLIEQKCQKKSYAGYMDALTTGDRRRFFKRYIEISNINTSHLYAAQLIAEGYVDCVVTTNFDNLMLKSLTLLNINPSVYDLTIARDNITSNFEFPAVIYMHGQNSGFWQLNTDYELELPVNAIRNAITKISTDRAWVVIGYSGNDPVLKQLASIDNFADGLFWIGYKNEDPNEKVRESLLDIKLKGSNIIKGFGSDDFFRQLKNELGMDEPQIIRKPFTQLLNAIANIQPVVIDDKRVDLCTETRKWIEQAIKGFEQKEGFENKPEISKVQIEEDELIRKVKEIYNSANYNEITNYESDIKMSNNPELIKNYSYIYWDWGWSLGNSAGEKIAQEKEKLLLESIDKTKKAIEILPNETLYDNWGWVLGEIAQSKPNNEKEKLFLESIEKCQKAIELNPKFEKSLYRWGWTLGQIATMKSGIEKEKLLREGIKKISMAIQINPEYLLAYDNWGWSLGEIALLKTGDEKEKLLWESIDKRKKAIDIDSDYGPSYESWGWALGEIASMKTGDEMENLFREGINKTKRGIEIKPADFSYDNWAWMLGEIATLKSGDEKEKLLLECIEKCEKAIGINPQFDKSHFRWGWALGEIAQLKTGDEKEKLLFESIAKYEKVIEINPDYELAYNNWGWMLSEIAKLKRGAEQEKFFLESFEKYKKAIDIIPDNKLAYENWGLALKDLAQLKTGDEKDRLLKESEEKFDKAK
jgi:tetratricopeptide (TPR) repeat protein